MKIHLIWAQEKDGGIGINNALPWHISSDLKNFKKLTTGKTVVMGRKTWLSLPYKPLPNRRNVVLSSKKLNNIESYDSVKKCINGLGEEVEVFVIGGAQIYKAFFNYANFLHITIINKKTNGIDTFFPVSLSEIKKSYSLDNSIRLSNNAEYTYWIKK